MTEIVSAELVATLVAVTMGLVILVYVRPSLTRTGAKRSRFSRS